MIRTIAIALCATAAMTASAMADTVFKGVSFVTATSGTCPFDSIGDRWNVSYHPFSVSGGTQAEHVAALNIFYNYGSQFNTLATGNFTSSLQATDNGGIGWSDYTSGTQSSVRIVSSTPSTLAANTPSAAITFEILNKDGDDPASDCKLTFDFNGLRQ